VFAAFGAALVFAGPACLVVLGAAGFGAAAEEEGAGAAGFGTPAVLSFGAATGKVLMGLVFGPGDRLGMRSDLI